MTQTSTIHLNVFPRNNVQSLNNLPHAKQMHFTYIVPHLSNNRTLNPKRIRKNFTNISGLRVAATYSTRQCGCMSPCSESLSVRLLPEWIFIYIYIHIVQVFWCATPRFFFCATHQSLSRLVFAVHTATKV